jgi:hypothetical protein
MKWVLKVPSTLGVWGAKGKLFFPGREYIVDDIELVGMAMSRGILAEEISEEKPKGTEDKPKTRKASKEE